MFDKLLGSVLKLRPGERRITALMGAYHFLLLGTFYLLKPAQESLFLVRLGADQLPFVFILAAVAVVPVTTFLARVGQRRSTPRLIAFTNLGLILFLALFWWLLVGVDQRWVYYAFDVFVNIFGLLTTSQFWLMANSAYDVGQAKRTFGWLNFAAILGAVVGGGVTSLLVDELRVRTATLVLYCAALLAISTILVLVVRRLHAPVNDLPSRGYGRQRESIRNMLGAIRSSPHLRIIVGLLATAMLTVTFVDFIFKDVAARAYPVQQELTAFFGQFYGGMNLLSLVLQFFVTYRLLRWLGVGGVVLLLPSALLLGAGAMVLVPGLLAAIVLRGADTGLKHSVDRTGRELLFLPVPLTVKKRVKVFVDAFVDRWFRGLAGVVLLIMINFLDLSTRTISGVVLVLAAAWVVLAWQARRSYVGAFREALERHEVDASDLQIDISEASTVRALIHALEQGNYRQQLYALDVLASVRDPQLPPVLRPLLYHEAPEIRRRALLVLSRQQRTDDPPGLDALLTDPDPDVRVEAVRFVVSQRLDQPRPDLLRELLHHRDARVRAGAVGFIAAHGRMAERALITPSLIEALMHEIPAAWVSSRVQLARALGTLNDAALYDARSDALIHLLEDPAPEVVQAAIEGMGQSRDIIFVPFLLGKLRERTYRGPVHHALAAYGEEVLDTLRIALKNEKEPLTVRSEITRVLRKMPSQAAVDALVEALPEAEDRLRFPLIKALNKLRAKNGVLRFRDDVLARVLRQEARDYYVFQRISLLLRPLPHPGARLLRRVLEQKQERLLERVFRLLGLHYPSEDIHSAYRGLTSTRRTLQASAIEFLDNVLDAGTNDLLGPMLSEEAETMYRRGRDVLDLPALDTPAQALAYLLESRETFLRACAVYFAASSDDERFREAVRNALDDPDPDVRAIAERALHPDPDATMTTVEKVILLQDLDLFTEVPAEQLAYLAAIAEEVFFSPGDEVYRANEKPDAFYVVVNGAVRLHQNGTEITSLGPGQAFGTWALFDKSPHLVTATVTDETRLLRIAREEFFDLLADYSQITQGVLKTVVQRMRALVERTEPAEA